MFEPDQPPERDPRLKPAYGFRGVDLQRSCNTCALLQVGDATHYCLRPEGPTFEAGGMDEWFVVCDRWRKIS
jgi:hypothetical protein